MPKLNADQIRAIVERLIPKEYRENPFIKALLAGAAAIAILLATPAFAPVGVVGATGWIIVYIVTGGTFTMDIFKKAWDSWKGMNESERKKVDAELERLKKLKDDGAITSENYQARVQELLTLSSQRKKA